MSSYTHHWSGGQPFRDQEDGHSFTLRVLNEYLPRLIVGGLFLAVGYNKIKAPSEFAREVRGYEMIPVEFTNLVALGLPWLEVIAAAVLIFGPWRRSARWILVGLLIPFTAVKIYMLTQGKPFECGCVGKDSILWVLFEGWSGVVTNIVLLALVLGDSISSCLTAPRQR